MKKFAVVLALLALLAALPAGAVKPSGGVLPDLSLPDTGGVKHLLRELSAGKVTLLVYWSVTCPVCVQEMPHLMNLARDFAGNPFRMLLVSGDEPAMKQAVAAYAAQQKLPQPWLLDLGPTDSMPLADAFSVGATPTIMVVNRAGKVVFTAEGHVKMDVLRVAVEKAF